MPRKYPRAVWLIPPVVIRTEQTEPALVAGNEQAEAVEDERERHFEYSLKVEEHADKFFEMRHKITFFLITGAAASIAYTLNFAIGRLPEVTAYTERKVCLVVAALAALTAMAFALFSLYFDVHSNRLNLAAYFQRKRYEELSEMKKADWGKAGRRARFCDLLAYTTLSISIVYQAVFLLLFIL